MWVGCSLQKRWIWPILTQLSDRIVRNMCCTAVNIKYSTYCRPMNITDYSKKWDLYNLTYFHMVVQNNSTSLDFSLQNLQCSMKIPLFRDFKVIEPPCLWKHCTFVFFSHNDLVYCVQYCVVCLSYQRSYP